MFHKINCNIIDHHQILKPKSAFVEEETMTRDKKGTSYDSEELIKIMEPIFEDMNKNIMKYSNCWLSKVGKNILILREPNGKMHQLA